MGSSSFVTYSCFWVNVHPLDQLSKAAPVPRAGFPFVLVPSSCFPSGSRCPLAPALLTPLQGFLRPLSIPLEVLCLFVLCPPSLSFLNLLPRLSLEFCPYSHLLISKSIRPLSFSLTWSSLHELLLPGSLCPSFLLAPILASCRPRNPARSRWITRVAPPFLRLPRPPCPPSVSFLPFFPLLSRLLTLCAVPPFPFL